MITVHLNKMKFIGFSNGIINYVSVFNIVKKYFLLPEKLLETLADQITEDIHKTDDRISFINIIIDKLNPPITTFTGTAGITYSKSFS